MRKPGHTTNRRYVSVEQIRAWAAEGVQFSVIDAKDGVDKTRVLLVDA